jgi:DNA-binding NarL/FixJ family response regulator
VVIKLAIIEDGAKLRTVLKMLIDGAEGYRVTHSFASVEQALQEIGRDLPDVVLVGIGLPGISGMEGIRLLKERYPSLLFLVLTISIKEVASSGAPISPEVARKVIELLHDFGPPVVEYHLTPHESRLLKLLVEGHNYKTAAAATGVTVHAVSFHMRRIYEKLQVHTKTEAVAKALRYRLVQ